MAEFQYRVITPEGKEKKGTMEGKSVEQVSGVLKAQKNVILSVSEASLRQGKCQGLQYFLPAVCQYHQCRCQHHQCAGNDEGSD